MTLRPLALPALLVLTSGAVARADDPPRPAPRAEAVFSEAQGDRVVLYIVPEGTRVTKGQVVCVLDRAPESDALTIQRINVRQAEASYEQARLTREVAEVAVTEYQQGTFKQSLETIQGDLARALADLKRAEDRLEWSKRMREKALISPAQLTSDRLDHEKARFALEQAETSKVVLLKYTKDKTVKELRSEVEKARADELAKKLTLDVERAKSRTLEATLRPGVVLAPIEGTVVLAKPARLVAVGAEVCKDQLLLRVVPAGK
jgi:HlyD family secretion protein